MKEEWRSVVGHDGYEVSNLGRVRSWRACGQSKQRRLTTPRIRKLIPNVKDGYLQVMLSGQSKLRLCKVHRLVLEAFVGPCPPGFETRHLNGERVDNRLCNLAWGTHAENIADKISHGTSQHGERNAQAKLTNVEADTIRASRALGRVLAAKFGVAESTISRIRNGVRRAG